MKYKILFLFLFICGAVYSQVEKVNFSQLDKSGMTSNILLSDIKPFTPLLSKNKTHFSPSSFSEAYQDLSASNPILFPNQEQIKAKIQRVTEDSMVSIGLIHTTYDWVSKKAFDNGWVSIQNNFIVKDSNKVIFENQTQTIIAPFTKRKKGLKTTFKFDNDYFINTTPQNILKVEVDFDDGMGYQILSTTQHQKVHYNEPGKKELNFKVYLQNGDVIQRSSFLMVDYSNEDLFDVFSINVQALTSQHIPDLSIYNETDLAPGVCEFEIFLSPDSILDKPIFVVDGFDPGDSRGILSVYNMLTYTDNNGNVQNLADYVRQEEGFDVVIVNFPSYTNANGNPIDGGADYIERNALTLVTLIEEINSQKIGNEQNVLIGPSMGGLITRYALRYMEMNQIDHDARLWISVDSPHNGANVAMAVQYLVNYLGYGYPDVDEIKGVVNGMLRSRAAQQMLVDHIDAHGSGSPLTPAGAPIYFNAFQNRMSTVGYPQNTRNISITNGSGTGEIFPDLYGNSVYPSYSILDGDVDAGTVFGLNTRLKVKAKFMPYANQTLEILNAKAQVQTGFWVTADEYSASAQQPSTSDGIDTAPGGLFDVIGLLDGFDIDPEYEDMLQNALAILNAGAFNFIPTTSAMALFNQPDYYYDFTALGEGDRPWDNVVHTIPETPFVNWYLADENEAHVKLTEGNIDFVLCELIEPEYKLKAISTNNVEICESQSFNTLMHFEILKGCFAESILEVQGNPAGSIAQLSLDTLTEEGLFVLHCESFPPGQYTLHVIPDGKIDKAVEISITVNENVPDLTGLTEYSMNGSGVFIPADNVTVPEGTDLELRLPTSLLNANVEWYDPAGNQRGATPTIFNIQENDIEVGMWSIEIDFNSPCNLLNHPTTLHFEIKIGDYVNIEENIANNFIVYPNPSNDIFNVKGIQSEDEVEVKITDLKGSLIIDKHFQVNHNQIQVDLSGYTEGIYVLTIKTQDITVVKKIIKSSK